MAVHDETDERILGKVQKLVDEERALYGDQGLDDQGRLRLDAIRVELDQCWDLLRQRRALREFGQNPDRAEVRPASIVEKYKQ